MTQLRSVTCHMGSHGVPCYQTQVNTPRDNPIHTGRYCGKSVGGVVAFLIIDGHVAVQLYGIITITKWLTDRQTAG